MRLHKFIRQIIIFPGTPHIEGVPNKESATHYIVEAQSAKERTELMNHKRNVYQEGGRGKANKIGDKVKFFQFPIEAYDSHFDQNGDPIGVLPPL